MRYCLSTVLAVIVALPLCATEPNPSTRQRELIEKLLDVTSASNTGSSVMDAMFGQIQKQFLENAAAKGNDPEDIEEAKELFTLFRERASQIDIDGLMREASIQIYAKYFTESELVDLTTFYASATGRKSIEVMPDLLREGMEAGVQHVAPKVDEVMAQVLEDQEKKRPWRRTMSQIRTVATALEAYAIDHEERYPNGDYASLKALLAPTYLKTFPEKDIWGHAYAYVVSPDGSSYRLVSSGSDGNFEWDSRRVATAKSGDDESDEAPAIRYRERLEDDVIFENGSFLQLPEQAKPKERPSADASNR
jgi:hypothetical protein